MNNMVSIIIPAREEPYLQQTISSLMNNAAEDIEIIVTLDGYWPNPSIKDDKRIIIVHKTRPGGMRRAINGAARISRGKYLMKIDAHCKVGPEYDKILKENCEPDWLCVPRRYGLDAENWQRKDAFVDYMALTFPYIKNDKYGYGLHGSKWIGGAGRGKKSWYKLENDRKDILLDDIMTYQGSCYFLYKDLFFSLGPLDADRYYNMYQETQELGMKVWLSGGRVVRNKKTWYAHLHKGGDKKAKRYKHMSKRLKYESENYSADYWMNDRWPEAKHNMKWFIEKFAPVPGWPEDWDNKEKYNGYNSDLLHR